MFKNVSTYIDEHGLKHVKAHYVPDPSTEEDLGSPISEADPKKSQPDQRLLPADR